MNLAVVIVNYKTGGLVADCLRSIAETTEPGQRPPVYVVDNASPDDSADVIEKAIADSFHSFASLIRADRNGGFAYGNNTGIRTALKEIPDLAAVLLLNPDTITLEGTFTSLRAALEDYPDAGLLGCGLCDPPEKCNHEYRHYERVQHSAFRFPSIASEFETTAENGVVSKILRPFAVAPATRKDPHQTDWLSGAALCVRRSVLDRVGPMDESYFLYYEETDYCRRAKALGFTCLYVPEPKFIHLEGQATGVAHYRHDRRPRYWFDSRRRYFITNHGRLYAIAADIAAIAGTLLSRPKGRLLRRDTWVPDRFARDLLKDGAISKGISP